MTPPKQNQGSAPTRLLLITDRPRAESLHELFTLEGFDFETVDEQSRAESRMHAHDFDTIVLDVKQPHRIIISCLERWRRDGVGANIVVVLGGPADRAACLDAGADVCLLHPVAAEELKAHLRALQRRASPPGVAVRRVHDLEINTAGRSVTRGGRAIHLTPREFDLLHLLATHQGKVLSRSMIVQQLYEDATENYSNVVDVYIRYLRGKIDKGFERPLILTRWGQGYLLRADGT
jgi:DNA-binding response OmpR family regulator